MDRASDSPTNFDRALKLCQGWPKDLGVPAALAELYRETEGDPDVGMFIEALYAAADSAEHLDLIAEAFEDVDEEE